MPRFGRRALRPCRNWELGVRTIDIHGRTLASEGKKTRTLVRSWACWLDEFGCHQSCYDEGLKPSSAATLGHRIGFPYETRLHFLFKESHRVREKWQSVESVVFCVVATFLWVKSLEAPLNGWFRFRSNHDQLPLASSRCIDVEDLDGDDHEIDPGVDTTRPVDDHLGSLGACMALSMGDWQKWIQHSFSSPPIDILSWTG